ncbi:hypothetical protein [Paraburkholderia hospita]|uniref:hypothetical protein n=1 Tax=Paraburkholderia hospita TaxID=169430 RepID=UPI00103D46DF|nr:hypothetical protein [Paraburkholderia hospita]
MHRLHNDKPQLKFSGSPADITAVNKKIVKPEHFTTSSGSGKGFSSIWAIVHGPPFSLHDIWNKAQARS